MCTLTDAMISGILLAAGSASRFGSNKLMHPWKDDIPMGICALRNLQSAINRVVVVVRDGDRVLQKHIRQEGAEVIICKNAHAGISASIQSGILATPHASGWVIALADMPAIHHRTVEAVAGELSSGAKLAAPCYRGTRGHPVGFNHLYYRELVQLRGDTGARTLLDTHAQHLSLIECDDPGIVYDIDRPQDIRSISHH